MAAVLATWVEWVLAYKKEPVDIQLNEQKAVVTMQSKEANGAGGEVIRTQDITEDDVVLVSMVPEKIASEGVRELTAATNNNDDALTRSLMNASIFALSIAAFIPGIGDAFANSEDLEMASHLLLLGEDEGDVAMIKEGEAKVNHMYNM